MALPINIEDLLNRRRVESNRIEFKAGWNPDKIYHTIAAFATDFDNIGGGYILVGVEEENGIAKRPVKGLAENEIDRIQKDMVGYDAKVSPTYLSKVSVEEVDGKNILVIWVPAGINRPYSVAESVVAKKSVSKFYIRSKSSTIEAKGEILDAVRELVNRVPFDERGNAFAKIDDISGVLVYEHLKKVGSKLAESFVARPLIDILDEMDLLTGPTECRQIKNCAIMMFCEYPEKFFPVTQVDIVLFPGGSIDNPDLLIEVPKIVGPVPRIIKETLSYLRTNVVKTKIIKPADTEKSNRIFNYPYQALEEAVVNALYHRDYQEREPVEITVEPTHIDILSYAGPDRSISAEAIKMAQKLKARRYRNRRLGDFLKELDLTEGRATGIPTIQKALKENGSAPATIDTDEGRTYFLLTIPCRHGFEDADRVFEGQECVLDDRLRLRLGQMAVQVEFMVNQCVIKKKIELGQILGQMFVQVWEGRSKDSVQELMSDTIDLLCLLRKSSMSANSLNDNLSFDSTKELKRKIILPLIRLGYVAMTYPDKPTSAKQTYRLTEKGRTLF